MIHTAKQLKDKVSNISNGDSEVAQMMIRNFIMERFLERLSLSMYNANSKKDSKISDNIIKSIKIDNNTNN